MRPAQILPCRGAARTAPPSIRPFRVAHTAAKDAGLRLIDQAAAAVLVDEVSPRWGYLDEHKGYQCHS